MHENVVRAAVIGSGFGGLSVAIRLQAGGLQTTLFEKRDKPGGRAYVYEDAGYTFDAGPTVITAPETLRELFALGGKRMEDYIELMPVSPFYRLCWENGFRFDYSYDEEHLLGQIRAKSPADVEGYQRFLTYAEEVFATGYEKLAHVPFLRFWDMVRVAPQLLKLNALRSVYGVVSKFIKDEELRQAFTFSSLLIGGNPFRVSSIYTLIHPLEKKWGVFFPRGGTHALVRALVRLFEDLGGKLLLNADIDEIVTNEAGVEGVRVKDGELQKFKTVVCNGDVTHAYSHLLRRSSRGVSKGKALQKARHSMSLFVLYFGTRKSYPGLAHHNVFFGKRYKELLADIFDNGVLAEDFSLYLHAPCLSDPSLAPPGGQSYYVLSPVPNLAKLDVDWGVVGPQYAKKILAYLDQHYMPGLQGDIVTQRFFTPADFKTELHAHIGSAFSLEPILTQSAYFRVHNRDAKIPGLYFVGAGTHPGAGVPGVINSAKATAGVVLETLRDKSLYRPVAARQSDVAWSAT